MARARSRVSQWASPVGRVKADGQLKGYGQIPVYRAVLDREGAATPGEVSVVGNEASVTGQLRHLEDVVQVVRDHHHGDAP